MTIVRAARRIGAALALFSLAVVSPAHAQPAPGPRPTVDAAVLDDLAAASRILADLGVLDGFGHVSMRHPTDPNRFMMSRSLAPALVTPDDIMEFDLDGNAVDARGRAVFLERFIHGEIYRARPDVNAVVHSHSPGVIPFSVSQTPLKPMYHNAAFLGAGVPVFEIRDPGGMTDMLVRNAALGKALAQTLADKPVALMRGHGDVAVGPTVQAVTFRAYYTEVNARLQAQAIGLGGPINFLTPEESAKADATNMQVLGRAWDLWKRKVTAK